MKEKKKIMKEPSGSVKVEPNTLIDATNYCKEHGIKITFFVTEAIKEKLTKIKGK